MIILFYSVIFIIMNKSKFLHIDTKNSEEKDENDQTNIQFIFKSFLMN